MRFLRRLAELGDVGTGDKRSPFANDQYGLRRVRLRSRERIVDPLPDCMRQGVDRGIVDGNHADIIDELVTDGGSHCDPLTW